MSVDLDLIAQAAREAGDIAVARRRLGLKIDNKPGGSPVTNGDLAVDAFLTERLRGARPDYGWLSEEAPDSAERLTRSHVFMIDPTAYEPALIEQGGEDVEGITIYTNFVPFEEADRSPETKLYLDWLQTTKPGATPDFFGVFSWSAARLFVELAAGLGGKLSRETLLEAIRGTDDWTANGLHAPQNVGPKRTGECFRFLQVRGGKFVPLGSRDYTCNGTTVVR